jgi:hypothetical protein
MASYRRSILFRLAADPISRLWSGYGPLDITDSLDPGGARYHGVGALLNVPALKLLINGTADRIEFQLSGVADETVRLAQEDVETIKDALVLIGEQGFDADWQVDGPPVWLWRGFADVLFIDSADGANGRERTIRLSVRSADTFRANPLPSYYTDADQRRRSPTDAICSHVAQISVGARRRFGPSS